MRIPISSFDISRGTIKQIAKSLRSLWPETVGHMQARTKLAVGLGYLNASDLEHAAKHEILEEGQFVDVGTVREVFAANLQQREQLPNRVAESIAYALPFEHLKICKGDRDSEDEEESRLTETARRVADVLLQRCLAANSAVFTIPMSDLASASKLEPSREALNGPLNEISALRKTKHESDAKGSGLVSSYAFAEDGKTLTCQLSDAVLQRLGVNSGESVLPGDLNQLPPPSQKELAWGRDNPDLYYFRRELLSRGFDVPLPLTFEEAEPLLRRAGMNRGNFTDINLKRQGIIWNDLEADGDDLSEQEIVAGDNYVGTVSFCSEVRGDYFKLKKLLKQRYPKAVTYRIEDETAFELVIAKPLTIRKLYDLMLEVEEDSWMYDSLRALSLGQNSLERRLEEPNSPPDDWAVNGDD